MIIYIAGPITGKYDYKRQFKKQEKKLHTKGHIVINPSHLPAGLKDYMPTCKAMIDQAEAVLFIHGWKESIGAKEEHSYAINRGKVLIFEQEA